MKVSIIVNHHDLGKAISRYLSFVYQIPSDYFLLTSLVQKGSNSFLNYEMIILETHDTNAVDYGVQFGKVFESQSIKITFFFTQNYFLSGYTIKDLPANCFYIPMQLKEFLNHSSKNEFAEKAATKLEQILFSNPLTSSHH
jgi:hypothetical protein